MKKWIILVLVFPVLGFSQEKHKVSFESVSVNPLSIYLGNNSAGLSISGDVGMSYKGHHFLISAQYGEELNIWSSFDDAFAELNFMWGKKFELASWLHWDGFAGLGYFHFKEANLNTRAYDRQTTVGIPLVSKLKCMIGNYFSVGIQLRTNINTAQTISSGGLVFQVDF